MNEEGVQQLQARLQSHGVKAEISRRAEGGDED